MIRNLSVITCFLCSIIYGQNEMIPYDRIIEDIKHSQELTKFIKKHDVKEIRFKVEETLYSFCENYNVFKKDNLTEAILKI